MSDSKAWRQYQARIYQKQQREARKFYEDKLVKNPDMPRYNHALAAMASESGQNDAATGYYRKALGGDSNNILLRSDMALHYSRVGRNQDAVDELKRGLLFNPKHNVLQKNLAGVYSRNGRYEEALSHAQEAIYIAPEDPMNHRNIAKVHEMLGDSRRSLEHNIKSINIENHSAKTTKHTNAYRSAARQIFVSSGKIDEGVALMAAARQIEGKFYESDTTQRTNEILAKIAKRRGNILAELEKEEAALAAKKELEEGIRQGRVGHLIPDNHAIVRGPPRPIPFNRQLEKKKHAEEEKKRLDNMIEGVDDVDDSEDDDGHKKKKKKKKKDKDKDEKKH